MEDHPVGRRLTAFRSGALFLVTDGERGRLCNAETGWQSPRPAPLGSLLAHAHAEGEWVALGGVAGLPARARALADSYPDWPSPAPTFDDLDPRPDPAVLGRALDYLKIRRPE